MDNNNASYNYIKIAETLRFCKQNGLTPLIGKPRTKMVIKDLWDKEKGGLFNGPFHNANADRLNYINQYWSKWAKIISDDPDMSGELHPSKVSIALDLAPDWNNNKILCCIDIDNQSIVDKFQVNLFKECPYSVGNQGIKMFFFSDVGGKQHIIYSSDDEKEHLVDIYLATSRLAFIYGEHPKSTKENPIFYELKNVGDVPFISNADLMLFINGFVKENNLYMNTTDKKKKELPPQRVNKMGKSKPRMSDMINIRISEVVGSTEDRIAHPVHGSTHASNLSLNHQDDTFYCFRCESGGGILEMIAIKEGIIECSESSAQSFFFNQSSTWNARKLEKWLELKKVLESKYKVDVCKYDALIRKWYANNKTGLSDCL